MLRLNKVLLVGFLMISVVSCTKDLDSKQTDIIKPVRASKQLGMPGPEMMVQDIIGTDGAGF
ncbi:MAG: hypothetical protein J7497_02755 [Chitinophagaceae bacterium]|nr:hypothetical protein [Chitinophagaceae bacterium]